jgi:hypothetical protein
MVASEMFLDTAQLRDSVVSHAKELNYLPRSFKSAYANVSISITPSTSVDTVTIPSKTTFTSRIGSETYNFVTKDSYVIASSNNGVFHANNVNLYEGVYVTDTFVKNSTIDRQRFVLTNPNIDTSSIELIVTENGGANVYSYTQTFSLFDLKTTSTVFFVQACENDQYEIVFGSGGSGRIPLNGAVLEATYRICNGELPNGADTFINNSSIDGHSNVSIVTNSYAIGGSVSESVDSIKFNAPRHFATQERAVTENDYRSLLIRQFPEINALSVYGGEKVDPPQYGKVFIAIDIEGSDGIPDVNKNAYLSYLQDKVSLGITPEIVQPEFAYLSVTSEVFYDYNSTTLTSEEIKTIVSNAIINFNSTNLDDFNKTFRKSNFTTAIDVSDPSIINNDTTIIPYFMLTPTPNIDSSFTVSFNTPILVTSPSERTHTDTTDKGVYSSRFTFRDLTCIMEDDGLGNIRIVSLSNDNHIEIVKVGTVNYETGSVVISNLNVPSFSGSGIKLYAKTISTDFTASLKYIIKINPSDVVITATPARR